MQYTSKKYHILHDVIDDVRIYINKKNINFAECCTDKFIVSSKIMMYCNNIYVNCSNIYLYFVAMLLFKTPTEKQKKDIYQHIQIMNHMAHHGRFTEGIISKMYAPKTIKDFNNSSNYFFTRDNALIIDTLRNYLNDNKMIIDKEVYIYCLASLLVKAIEHKNDSGNLSWLYDYYVTKTYNIHAQHHNSVKVVENIIIDIPEWKTNYNNTVQLFQLNIINFISLLPSDIDILFLDYPYHYHDNVLNTIVSSNDPLEIEYSSMNINEIICILKKIIVIGFQKTKYILILITYNDIIKKEGVVEILSLYDYKTYYIDHNIDLFKIQIMDILA